MSAKKRGDAVTSVTHSRDPHHGRCSIGFGSQRASRCCGGQGRLGLCPVEGGTRPWLTSSGPGAAETPGGKAMLYSAICFSDASVLAQLQRSPSQVSPPGTSELIAGVLSNAIHTRSLRHTLHSVRPLRRYPSALPRSLVWRLTRLVGTTRVSLPKHLSQKYEPGFPFKCAAIMYAVSKFF